MGEHESTAIGITFSAQSQKQIKKLDPPVRKRILDKIQDMRDIDPYQDHKSSQLTSPTNKGIWKHRVGDWRVTFSYDQGAKLITILEVCGRGDKSVYN